MASTVEAASASQLPSTVPVTVPKRVLGFGSRTGTNVEAGRKIIQDSGIPIITADTLADAAEKAVAAYKNAK